MGPRLPTGPRRFSSRVIIEGEPSHPGVWVWAVCVVRAPPRWRSGFASCPGEPRAPARGCLHNTRELNGPARLANRLRVRGPTRTNRSPHSTVIEAGQPGGTLGVWEVAKLRERKVELPEAKKDWGGEGEGCLWVRGGDTPSPGPT